MQWTGLSAILDSESTSSVSNIDKVDAHGYRGKPYSNQLWCANSRWNVDSFTGHPYSKVSS